MSEPFIASIIIFAGNYAPRGWAFCNGQILPISQNQALFSLIGTTYGGNGTSTFGLPDLRSRVPLHCGNSSPGAGLSTYVLGQQSGTETVSLNISQMPVHTHQVSASTNLADQTSPASAFPATVAEGSGRGATTLPSYTQSTANTTMAASMISPAGSGVGHSNIQPILALNFIIALQGIFPSRN